MYAAARKYSGVSFGFVVGLLLLRKWKQQGARQKCQLGPPKLLLLFILMIHEVLEEGLQDQRESECLYIGTSIVLVLVLPALDRNHSNSNNYRTDLLKRHSSIAGVPPDENHAEENDRTQRNAGAPVQIFVESVEQFDKVPSLCIPSVSGAIRPRQQIFYHESLWP